MINESRYKLRFIHASDIHLGSVMHVSDMQSQGISSDYNTAVYDAFHKICNEAIRNSVDFIILAGDVYDRELRTVKASRAFYEESKLLEEHGIHIYLLKGNHDPIGENNEIFSMPENVHIFDCEKVQVFEIRKEGQLVGRIIGQSYRTKWEGKKIFKDYNIKDNDVYNIGVLHTGLESEKSNYIPCSLEELKAVENINYWALGHIHKRKVLHEEKPFIAYPGIPQGRDIGEEGIGGCYLVEVSEDFSEKVSYIKTSSFVWRKDVVNLEKDFHIKPSSLNELEELLIQRGESIIGNTLSTQDINLPINYKQEDVKGIIIHWQIEGRTEIDKILREDYEAASYLKERLNNHFWRNNTQLHTEFIGINTLKEIPLYYLNSNNEVIDEMNDVLQAISVDDKLKRELTEAFGSVFEEYRDTEDINEEKLMLDEELIEEILRTSQDIIIEKFLEKGEYY